MAPFVLQQIPQSVHPTQLHPREVLAKASPPGHAAPQMKPFSGIVRDNMRDEHYHSYWKQFWEIRAKFTLSATFSICKAFPRKLKVKPNHKSQWVNKIWEKTTLWEVQSLLLPSAAVTQWGTSTLENQNNFESTTEWLMTLQCTHTTRRRCLLGFQSVPPFLLISL